MPRKKIVEEVSLDTLIPQYAENKAMLDDYKKICDNENKQIKELMEEGTYTVGGYKATKSVQVRASFDENKLIEVLKSINVQGVIKKREYADLDALEAMIYEGKLTEDDLLKIDKCRISKEIVTLKVTKEKK